MHVSSHRTAMSARFVTQDSDVCTFRRTGQRCLHVSSYRTGYQTQARVKNRAAIVHFIFFLSFFLSFFLCIFVVVAVVVYMDR